MNPGHIATLIKINDDSDILSAQSAVELDRHGKLVKIRIPEDCQLNRDRILFDDIILAFASNPFTQ